MCLLCTLFFFNISGANIQKFFILAKKFRNLFGAALLPKQQKHPLTEHLPNAGFFSMVAARQQTTHDKVHSRDEAPE